MTYQTSTNPHTYPHTYPAHDYEPPEGKTPADLEPCAVCMAEDAAEAEREQIERAHEAGQPPCPCPLHNPDPMR